MLSNRTRPMIGKLSELLVTGYRPMAAVNLTSPRSPFDLKIQSPRGMKNYDLGGVGLGIAAALDKASEHGKAKYYLCRSSSPKPVNSCPRTHPAGFNDVEDFDSSEDYTYVTCHSPDKIVTKVYYDGGSHDGIPRHIQVMDGFVRTNDLHAIKSTQDSFLEDYAEYPMSDFLSSCYLCKKKLQDQDIFMYRGEKGFCSPECRSSHMMMGERKELCRSEASKSVDVPTTPYTNGQIFSNGIFAV